MTLPFIAHLGDSEVVVINLKCLASSGASPTSVRFTVYWRFLNWDASMHPLPGQMKWSTPVGAI